ncbi:hypothetical protein GS471_06290 [Rhodococcus hoagii]|nr:hypothetical protein [Prescottella equi]
MPRLHGDRRHRPRGRAPDLMHGPVTVFDTAAGRIVGTTSIAADGSRWTSLSPGHPGRLRQALVGLLDELV